MHYGLVADMHLCYANIINGTECHTVYIKHKYDALMRFVNFLYIFYILFIIITCISNRPFKCRGVMSSIITPYQQNISVIC